MSVIFWQNKVLFHSDGKLAMDPACCCGPAGSCICPLLFDHFYSGGSLLAEFSQGITGTLELLNTYSGFPSDVDCSPNGLVWGADNSTELTSSCYQINGVMFHCPFTDSGILYPRLYIEESFSGCILRGNRDGEAGCSIAQEVLFYTCNDTDFEAIFEFGKEEGVPGGCDACPDPVRVTVTRKI